MMEIRGLQGNEIASALELAREVFMEFEAPDYPLEGIEEFIGFLGNRAEIGRLRFVGALDQNVLLGVLAMREEHISLLFVKKEFHRRGIAKALFSWLLEHFDGNRVTVNSSPYAKAIYEKLGFAAVDTERQTNGIRYIPMVYDRG